jgi:hypothetical protein
MIRVLATMRVKPDVNSDTHSRTGIPYRMLNSAANEVNHDAWKLYSHLALSYFLGWGLASLTFQVFFWMHGSSYDGELTFFFFPVFELLMVVVFVLPIIGIGLGLIGFRNRLLLWLAGLSVVKLLLVTSSWLNALDVVVDVALLVIPIVWFVRVRQ